MRIQQHLGGALLATAASVVSLAIAPGAQASVTCSGGGATSTLASFTVALAKTAGFSCQVGDKVLSEFDFTNATGFKDTDGFTFNDNVALATHTLQYNGDAALAGMQNGVFSGFFTYRITAVGLADLAAYQADIQSVRQTGATIPTHSLQEIFPTIGTIITAPPNTGNIPFSSLLKTAVMKSSYQQFANSQIRNLQDTFIQTQPEKVPGPLSLLGAGAAFAYSRKLRNRVKAVA